MRQLLILPAASISKTSLAAPPSGADTVSVRPPSMYFVRLVVDATGERLAHRVAIVADDEVTRRHVQRHVDVVTHELALFHHEPDAAAVSGGGSIAR
jgi:hypothetical protein